MKTGTSKAGHKYISRKKVKGKYLYLYKEGVAKRKPSVKVQIKPSVKAKKQKIKVRDYYQPGRHKYFRTEADKKTFLRMEKQGLTGGKGQKILSTGGRIKKGTKVFFTLAGKRIQGRVVDTDGTTTKSPTKFDVEYESGIKKISVKRNISKKDIERVSRSWSEKQTGKLEERYKGKKEKVLEMRKEAKTLTTRDVDNKIKKQAQDLVNANWPLFGELVGKYWNRRIKTGWDASKMGFDEEDLKQEAWIIVYNAALSYLSNPPKDKRATYLSYTKSFLKANLAAKLAASSGAGGHLKASAKDQLYLWFFKDTVDEYRAANNGAIPDDVKMMEILNRKRKALPEEKGNLTIKQYEWTIEKVKNKKMSTRKMESLDRNIMLGGGTADTLLSILNDEELELAGRYKIDPWIETQKQIVKDGVRDAIKRKFGDPVDRGILIRIYGLFVDEDSPKEVRKYALGQTPSQVAKYVNQVEARRGSIRRWTGSQIEERETNLLRKLQKDKEFVRKMKDFVKSENPGLTEWPDTGLIMYWIIMYKIVSEALDVIVPDVISELPESEADKIKLVFEAKDEKQEGRETQLVMESQFGTDEIENEKRLAFVGRKKPAGLD